MQYTHTHSHTHSHTHTHTVWSAILVGTPHRRNGFYTVQTVFSITLRLNLPLTGNSRHFLIFKKLYSVLFISLFPHGDLKNVHTRSTFTGITILVGIFGPHNVINTRYTHTHTHTHTHTLNTLCGPPEKLSIRHQSHQHERYSL